MNDIKNLPKVTTSSSTDPISFEANTCKNKPNKHATDTHTHTQLTCAVGSAVSPCGKRPAACQPLLPLEHLLGSGWASASTGPL